MLRQLGDRFREGGFVGRREASGGASETTPAVGGVAAKYVAETSRVGLEDLLAGNFAGMEKIAAGIAAEAAHQEKSWHAFLAGDDRPVGSDLLPPPGVYYAPEESES